MRPAAIAQGTEVVRCTKAGSRQRHERCPVAGTEATRVRQVTKSSTVEVFLVRAVIPPVL